MNNAHKALLAKVRAVAVAALGDGCEVVADEARMRAGSLAPGVVPLLVEVVGNVIAGGIESRPVPDHAPPAVREFGSARSLPYPYFRPAINRARQRIGQALAHKFRSH